MHKVRCSKTKTSYRCLLSLLVSLVTITFNCPAYALRAWSIEDTIQFSKISQGDLSHDEKYLPVVTTRGNLQTNKLESRLWLLSTVDAERFLNGNESKYSIAPRLLITMDNEPTSSWEESHVITDLHWSPDDKKIFFLARSGKNSESRLYSAEIESGHLMQLSLDGQDVTTFDANSESCVYLSTKTNDPEERFQSGGSKLPSVVIATGKPLLDLLYPNRPGYTTERGKLELWSVPVKQAKLVASNQSKIELSVTAPIPHVSLSPDGKHAVVANNVDTVPPEWEQYSPCRELLYSNLIRGDFAKSDRKNRFAPEAYILIDLATGKSTSLINAPLAACVGHYDATVTRWSTDGTKILLSGIFCPPETDHSDGKYEGTKHLRPCVLIVDVSPRRVSVVSERPDDGKTNILTFADWANKENAVDVQYGQGTRERFKDINGQWQVVQQQELKSSSPSADKSNALDQIQFLIKKSVNQPNILMIKDNGTSKEKVFFDPNPQLAEIEMNNLSTYTFRSPSGREITAALIKPLDYQKGKRYPLIIQGYGYSADIFLGDSYFSSAFPGRAAVARGIIVVQPKDTKPGNSMLPEGINNACESYISCADQLAKDGLIDPTKVGIIGFSHSGAYVLHALTRKPETFKAAVLAEVTTDSFTEYLNSVDWGPPAFRHDIEIMEGGKAPFGDGLKDWTTDAPGFNTEKIKAAVMFQEYTPSTLAWSWDIYPAMRAQGKPVELLYMRNGQHELLTPKLRYLSQIATLDWFDFWLNDHEDPDASKAEQYRRWRAMRGGK